MLALKNGLTDYNLIKITEEWLDFVNKNPELFI